MSHNHARGFSFFVLLSLAIAAAAFAAKPISEAPAVTADVTVSASAVQWQTAGSFERLALTVGGPDGYTLQKEFAAGAAPVLRLQDLGAKLADGSYTWELRVVPRISAETRQKLAAAREAGDDDAIARIRAEAGIERETSFSGGFTIMAGSFVSNKGEEPAPAGGGKKIVANGLTPGAPKVEDVVTADDEIIQGSLCVGLDCVNNESFGFDTIRLKENNTRIKFDDTSTSAGFPANDWQLTANDSASGGASKFSIEDITGAKVPFTVTAGAATNSLFVASSGKVGFGNSSPVLNLHITTTDTPAIRQEQTSGGGFTAQTWDIGANEANWFVRDVTGGSRLPLRIRPGAPTSSLDISADGDIGINTASPNANTKVDVFDSTQVKARIALTGQEFLQAANTSTDGIAVLLGANRTGNRQLWIGDTAALTQNATNKVIRIFPNNTDISARTTDGGTTNLSLQVDGGSLGIGTSSPASKLHVNGGDIRVSGGSFIDDGVTLNVPDYVFDSTYKLMSIEELAKFVQTEKHLPNIPSVSNVKAEGLNMSQFQMRLLEKVEELTLYTIDLKAQNEQLQKRLEALETQQVKQ
jgi:hypothetical protein